MSVKEEKYVYIRRKFVKSPLGGDPTKSNWKIGGSLKGTVPQSGLNRLEEKAWLSELLGISENAPDWGKQIKAYCNNITVPIPHGDGKKLNITLLKEATDKEVAVPANVADYVLYRYCLVYNRVANNESLINKSPRIKFFIYDETKEKTAKMNAFELRKKANTLFYSLLEDNTKFEAVLKIMMADHDLMNEIKVPIINTDKVDEHTKQLALDSIARNPKTIDKFIKVCENTDLLVESFIEDCIHYGKLERIPNTATIRKGTNIIGNTMEEAIAFIKSATNGQTVLALKAELKSTTNKDYNPIKVKENKGDKIPNIPNLTPKTDK